jgi:hypothetical protein
MKKVAVIINYAHDCRLSDTSSLTVVRNRSSNWIDFKHARMKLAILKPMHLNCSLLHNFVPFFLQ